MEKIVFEDPWQEFFAEAGLNSFDDFFNYAGGETINKNQRRDVSILSFGDGTSRKVFFRKRFHNPHYKDILSSWRNFGRPTPLAEAEWENLHLLLDNGIDTYKAVCFGRRTSLGLERKSFIITEKLQSTELIEFLPQKWHQIQHHQKQNVVTAMAKLARRAHKLNITLPDLSVWHIFIDEDSINGDCRLSVIDLHRMATGTESQSKKIRDLGRLFWSMSPKYFDDNLKDLFINAYMDNDWPESKTALLKKIQRRANVIAKRRKIKDY